MITRRNLMKLLPGVLFCPKGTIETQEIPSDTVLLTSRLKEIIDPEGPPVHIHQKTLVIDCWLELPEHSSITSCYVYNFSGDDGAIVMCTSKRMVVG